MEDNTRKKNRIIKMNPSKKYTFLIHENGFKSLYTISAWICDLEGKSAEGFTFPYAAMLSHCRFLRSSKCVFALSNFLSPWETAYNSWSSDTARLFPINSLSRNSSANGQAQPPLESSGIGITRKN